MSAGGLRWRLRQPRLLERIDSLTGTEPQIMAGDLSGRLAVTGSGDEFDRLADSLNAMLDRIEHLLYGLKSHRQHRARPEDAADAAAHRVEGGAAGRADAGELPRGAGDDIEESDQLIKTFNALLRSRAPRPARPTGHDRGRFPRISGVADLYEPVAEESGVELKVETPEASCFKGSRELLARRSPT